MNKFFTALMCVTAVIVSLTCRGENVKKDTTAEKNETKTEDLIESGFAVKYSKGGITFIYTRKGSNKRLDYFDSDGAQSVFMEVYIKGDGMTGYGYDGYSWSDSDYRARQTVNNYYGSGIMDLTQDFAAKGYSKTGTTTICGKECEVYSGQLTENLNISAYEGFSKGKQGEIAVWNGITMRTKLEGKITSEVVALSFNIPDEAFGKTTEITWIK